MIAAVGKTRNPHYRIPYTRVNKRSSPLLLWHRCSLRHCIHDYLTSMQGEATGFGMLAPGRDPVMAAHLILRLYYSDHRKMTLLLAVQPWHRTNQIREHLLDMFESLLKEVQARCDSLKAEHLKQKICPLA